MYKREMKIKCIALCILLLVSILSGCTSGFVAEKIYPFSHIYRVSEILCQKEDHEQVSQMMVELNAYQDLYIMSDVSTYVFEDVGTLIEIEQADDDTRNGVWALASESGSTAYELAVEANNSITLTKMEDHEIYWKCILERVDTVNVNTSTFGRKGHLWIDWFYRDTFPGDLSILSSDNFRDKGKIGLAVEDESIAELTVYEEYHSDHGVENNTIHLNSKDGFSFEVKTRYETPGQYAVYRIPYQNGDYYFYIVFE